MSQLMPISGSSPAGQGLGFTLDSSLHQRVRDIECSGDCNTTMSGPHELTLRQGSSKSLAYSILYRIPSTINLLLQIQLIP